MCGIPPLFRRDHYLRGRGALISPGAGAPGSLRCKSARVVELPAPERLKNGSLPKNRGRISSGSVQCGDCVGPVLDRVKDAVILIG